MPGKSNRLRLRLSPEVVIALQMRVKLAGEGMEGEDVEMIASHQQGDEMSPYERLLGDALRGDQQLFAREDSIEAQWRIVNEVLDNATPVYSYDRNSWGPPEAGNLLKETDRWSDPTEAAVKPK
jgi:glucose-6-phosphate 1-dehydrogenase